MRSALPALFLLVSCTSDKTVGVFNSPPEASIISPISGTAVDEGQVIEFEAIVDDDHDSAEDLVVRWSSSLDGEFSGPFIVDQGFARFETANLSPGNHDISVIVTDSKEASAQDTIQVVVNDLPEAPEIDIVRPTRDDIGVEGETFEFVAQVSDSRDESDALVLRFESDLDGVFCEPAADSVGVARCEESLSPGTHNLTFTVTDSEDYESAATTIFVVLARTGIDDDGDGFSEDDGDCNDGDASVNPGATEVYNSRDDDCDDLIDEGTEGYDDDGDGYTEIGGDCDDTNANTYPGARETCDDLDNDCDTIIDETTVCYDDDGDGWTDRDGDCDDEDGTSYPGSTEVPDGADNDCDGVTDEGTTWYDDDGDGYAEIDGDCNDSSASIHPAASETCGDGTDNDCDGTADEANASGCTLYYYDYDGDGYGTTTSSCLCTQTGYYTSRYATDCYDSHADANPGQTSWYTNSRGDGSFDWNCDGSQTKRYTQTMVCSGLSASGCAASTSGWRNSSSNPACGSNGTWYTDCDWSWSSFSCSVAAGGTSRTQECR